MRRIKRKYLIEAGVVLGVFVIALAVGIPYFIQIQNINTETNFPDPEFRKLVEQYLLKQPGEPFNRREADAVSMTIRANNPASESIKGIEFLSGTAHLDIVALKDTHLDLSSLSKLTVLRITNNQDLESLILRGNESLLHLNIFAENLEEIDLSGCTMLHTLVITYAPQLRSLTLPPSENLTTVSIGLSRIKTLDVSQAPNIHTLTVDSTPLTRLDLSQQEIVQKVDCRNNDLSEILFHPEGDLLTLLASGNEFTTFDLSAMHTPVWVDLSNNPLREIVHGEASNVRLLKLSNTELGALDLSGYDMLEGLHVSNSELRVLRLGNAGALRELHAWGNHLEAVPALSGSDDLTLVDLRANRLSEEACEFIQPLKDKLGDAVVDRKNMLIRGVAVDQQLTGPLPCE